MNQDYLWSYQFIVDKENLWFVPFWYPILCKYQINKKELVIVQRLPLRAASEGNFINLVKVDNSIILMPMQKNVIYLYEIDKNLICSIPLREDIGHKLCLFSYGVWKNKVYMFSHQSPFVVKFDIDTRINEYIHLECFSDGDNSEISFLLQRYVEKNMVYFISRHSNCILRFDMETERGKYIYIGNPKDYYLSICKVFPDRLFLINQNGELVVFHESEENVIAVRNAIPGFYKEKPFREYHYFIECVEYHDFIYFFASSMVIRVNSRNYEIEKVDFCDCLMAGGIKRVGCFSDEIFSVKRVGEYIYVENMYRCSFFRIHMLKKVVEQFSVPLKWFDVQDMDLSGIYETPALEGEAMYYNLEDMFQYLEKNKKQRPCSQLAGKKIWDVMKGKLT